MEHLVGELYEYVDKIQENINNMGEKYFIDNWDPSYELANTTPVNVLSEFKKSPIRLT